MLEAKVDEKFNKKNLDEALAVVSELRNNQDVLSLLSKIHDGCVVWDRAY